MKNYSLNVVSCSSKRLISRLGYLFNLMIFSATSARDRVQNNNEPMKRVSRNLYRWPKDVKAFILSDWMYFFSYSFRNLTITKQMYFPWNIWTQQGLCQTSAEKLGKLSVYGIVVAIGRSKWSFALSLMRFSHDMVCWKHSLGAKNCCHKTICWFRIAIVFHLTDEAK